MIGRAILQWVRSSAHLMDKGLRDQLSSLEKPFRWLPRFVYSLAERVISRYKTYPVLIEFGAGKGYEAGFEHLQACIGRHSRCKMKYEHPTISSCSARLSVAAIRHMLENSEHVVRIHYDREVKAMLDVATPSLRANQLQEHLYTGRGVTIAILDTGIYPHPDLTRGRNRITGFVDLVQGKTVPYDDNGHGTHCAGDAAGNGYASFGRYRAPASEANVVGVKVLDKNGSGSLSTIIAGIEWCIANRQRYKINIISMSLGSPGTSAANDPLVRSVEHAWQNGIVVVVAAGNEGPDPQSISSPGTSTRVITVGAMNDLNTTQRTDDQIAPFSSRGPTPDGAIKPDLVCPGVNIVSLRAPSSYLDRYYRMNRVGTYYFSESGTSMATPLCAGVVAQLLQAYPGLTPDQVKERLLNSAVDLGISPYVQGRGYLDASRLLPPS